MIRYVCIALFCSIAGEAQAATASVRTVEAFRAAREAGRLERAQTFLSDDPRVWYDVRVGEGLQWTLGGGRWKAWDEHFNGRSDIGPWTVDGDTVWAVAEETNDYFRLLERRDVARYRISYFFDVGGKILGYMISAAEPEAPVKPRDPTGDRAPRTRSLLVEWRRSVGLPALTDP